MRPLSYPFNCGANGRYSGCHDIAQVGAFRRQSNDHRSRSAPEVHGLTRKNPPCGCIQIFECTDNAINDEVQCSPMALPQSGGVETEVLQA